MTELMQSKCIPLSEPVLQGNEWKYIKECLDTGWISSAGSYVNKFEEMIASYVGVSHAIAVVNGTAALHLALIVAGVKEDDEVIVSTLTFIAPVNAVHYVGANPVFMDCDPATACLDVKKVQLFLLEECILADDGFTYHKTTQKRVSAVIPVHVFGHPTDMDSLKKICAKMNIRIIEDATESLGSAYQGKKTGSLGDIGCLSFNGNKIITTGGGGMLVTNNKEWATRARHLSTQAKKDPFNYDHDEIGYNYRLTNIAAAMGVAQLEALEAYVARKRGIAAYYKKLFESISQVKFFQEMPWAVSNYWLATIGVAKEDRLPLLIYLNDNNIQARPAWKLIHTLPMYNQCETYDIKQATEVWASIINIPCSVSITEADLIRVVETIISYYRSKKS